MVAVMHCHGKTSFASALSIYEVEEFDSGRVTLAKFIYITKAKYIKDNLKKSPVKSMATATSVATSPILLLRFSLNGTFRFFTSLDLEEHQRLKSFH